MDIDSLENMESRIRNMGIPGAALTNTGVSLRSCGCILLTLSFEGLLADTFINKHKLLTESINSEGLGWHLLYINPFPGTNMVGKVTFRRLCSHCMENFRMEGSIGMGSMIIEDRTGE